MPLFVSIQKFYFYIDFIILGKHSAISLAEQVSEKAMESKDNKSSDATNEVLLASHASCSASLPTSDSVLDALIHMGLIYVHYGNVSWNVFVSRTLNSTIEIDDPRADGVLITWCAGGPTDEELAEIKDISRTSVREYRFTPTTYKLFIPCTRELSQDSSQRHLTRLPKQKYRWDVITVPFFSDERHVMGMMDPALLAE